MQEAKKLKPNMALVMVLLVLLLGNSIATFFDYGIVPKITKLITVTILLTFYFCQLHKMANVFLTIFLVFFLGDALSVFGFGDLSLKLSKSMYIGAYLLLIFVLFGKLRRVKFEGLVSVYLILVLILNSYFLYALYGVAKENFVDDINLILYIFHGITLIAMTFFAFAVYLSRETAQSITFLLMVFSFVFADVLNYICSLYVYYWVFEMFEGILHTAGLFLLYKYVYDHHTQRYSDKRINLSEYFIPTTESLRQIRVNF
ncbi:hypothetical protein SAMN04515667_2408 [Formosa sp. Hel1_31_208]|uniref:hypothetical protein n=1 Tax=Formosa sp. Hel1_31_208 TaxID=1798225 RepID=UPI000879B036|nr:hypothetical protein [Formosa sp. Hel1_31_208]SDS54197.1 hypothetical protein SAMN04515667_2408 [Formosa sp. Hel1_31_208]